MKDKEKYYNRQPMENLKNMLNKYKQTKNENMIKQKINITNHHRNSSYGLSDACINEEKDINEKYRINRIADNDIEIRDVPLEENYENNKNNKENNSEIFERNTEENNDSFQKISDNMKNYIFVKNIPENIGDPTNKTNPHLFKLLKNYSAISNALNDRITGKSTNTLDKKTKMKNNSHNEQKHTRYKTNSSILNYFKNVNNIKGNFDESNDYLEKKYNKEMLALSGNKDNLRSNNNQSLNYSINCDPTKNIDTLKETLNVAKTFKEMHINKQKQINSKNVNNVNNDIKDSKNNEQITSNRINKINSIKTVQQSKNSTAEKSKILTLNNINTKNVAKEIEDKIKILKLKLLKDDINNKISVDKFCSRPKVLLQIFQYLNNDIYGLIKSCKKINQIFKTYLKEQVEKIILDKFSKIYQNYFIISSKKLLIEKTKNNSKSYYLYNLFF